jgi:TPR repeat protein
VRALDRWSGAPWLERVRGQTLGLRLDPQRRNLAHMAVWIVLFTGAYSVNILDKHHPGARRSFWETACAQDLRNACRSLSTFDSTECDAGSAQRCDDLGVLLMEKARTPAAFAEAARVFDRACELGSQSGCANLAIHQLFHDPHGTLPPALVERLERLCAANDGRACYLQGFALEQGRGFPRDPLGALEHYTRACAARWKDGCSAAGKLALRGEAGPPDPVMAAASFTAACEQSDSRSCVQLAVLYRDGRVPTPPDLKPEGLLRRACDLGLQEACRAVEVIGH